MMPPPLVCVPAPLRDQAPPHPALVGVGVGDPAQHPYAGVVCHSLP